MQRCLSVKKPWTTKRRHLMIDFTQEEQHLSMSLEALMLALKASSSTKDLDAGKRIHSDACSSSITSSSTATIFVANTLINMYAKCGSVADAIAVFNAIPDHTIVSWNALVLAFALNSREEQALEAIDKIRQQGLEPNARTFVAGLKACAGLSSSIESKRSRGGDEDVGVIKLKLLERGMELHSQALAGGVLSDIYVGNGLIDMYSKCGSLLDARKVFDSMPRRDVVSWTCLISGCAENREETLALELFPAMEMERCCPNSRTYIAALAACSNLAERDRSSVHALQRTAVAIHSRALGDGSGSDMFLASSMVNLYVKCGNLNEARFVFDGMIQRDVVTWSCLILGYAENGDGELALDLFRMMIDRHCEPNARTYVAALVACSSLAAKEAGQILDGTLVKMESLKIGRALHFETVRKNFESEVFVGNALVDMYSKCGSLMDAKRVFDRMPVRDAVSWSTLILGYADNRHNETGLELFELMRSSGTEPTARTFVSVLVAVSNLAASKERSSASCLELATKIHDLASRSNCDEDTFVANALIDLYVKCESLPSARTVFDRLVNRDSVSWNTMILGYAEHGQDELALELFARMIQLGQCRATARTFVAALQACAGLAAREGSGDRSNKSRCLEKVMEIHSRALDAGTWDIYLDSAVINAYGKCGSVRDARLAFDKMELHDVVSYTSLLLGYVDNGESELGLDLFAASTKNTLLSPNARTFAAAVMAAGNLARLDTGKNIHAEACRQGFETDLLLASCLVDLYGKCGSAGDAEMIFDSIETKRDPVLWSSLVSVNCGQGNTARVFEVFNSMLRENVVVNGVTFLSLLTACSRAGMIDSGRRLFRGMGRVFGVAAAIEHYHCVVDMLGRGNRLEEALEVVENMPFDPTIVTWTTVLAACGKWNNVVVGRIAYGKLIKLDATQAATYSLMAKLEAVN